MKCTCRCTHCILMGNVPKKKQFHPDAVARVAKLGPLDWDDKPKPGGNPATLVNH